MEGMSALMADRPRDAAVFTAPQGGPVTDGHFRNRVWYPAVEAAGIRRFSPRIMRRSAASAAHVFSRPASPRSMPTRSRRVAKLGTASIVDLF